MLRTADRAAAEEARSRAGAGTAFRDLAGAVDLGGVAAADLAAPLREAAARLTPGQASDVLETPEGYVVLFRER
jgi:parvulin-like peptidyl-prolyl isomerase